MPYFRLTNLYRRFRSNIMLEYDLLIVLLEIYEASQIKGTNTWSWSKYLFNTVISALADCPHTSLIWQRSSVLTCLLFFLSCHKQAKRQPNKSCSYYRSVQATNRVPVRQIFKISSCRIHLLSPLTIFNWSTRSTIIYTLDNTIKGIHEIHYRNIAGRCLDYS